MAKPVPRLSAADIREVIATAWDDRPPFDRVLLRHGLSPGQLLQLLRRELTPQAFRLWRERSSGRSAPGKRSR
jgi:uncharacterized protein (TIGR03643 family)